MEVLAVLIPVLFFGGVGFWIGRRKGFDEGVESMRPKDPSSKPHIGMVIVLLALSAPAAMAQDVIEFGEFEITAPKIERQHVCFYAGDAEDVSYEGRYSLVMPDRAGRYDIVHCTTKHAAEIFVTERVPHRDRGKVVIDRLKDRIVVVTFDKAGRDRVRVMRPNRWWKVWRLGGV